jgi:hypothetical protein
MGDSGFGLSTGVVEWGSRGIAAWMDREGWGRCGIGGVLVPLSSPFLFLFYFLCLFYEVLRDG